MKASINERAKFDVDAIGHLEPVQSLLHDVGD